MFSFRVTLVGVIAFVGPLASTSLCNPIVLEGPIVREETGSEYYLISPSQWDAAQAKAVELGGTLATIEDADEQAWIFNTFQPLSFRDNYWISMWIGLNERQVEGDFSWVSGSKATYRKWGTYEPSGWREDQNDVAMFMGPNGNLRNGDWYVAYPTSSTFGLVEVGEVFSVPTPGDANYDFVVDLIDLSILAANFGQYPRDWTEGDFDGSGEVTLSDLSLLASNFGKTWTLVPEPSGTLAFVTLGLSAFGRKR